MKLNNPNDPSLLGGADLGGAGQRWAPPDVHFYERQWRTQRGAWGDPDQVADRLDQDVRDVVAAFRERGTPAGLRLAQARGVLAGAHAYLAARGDVEEELAVKLARLRAALAKRATLDGRIVERFLLARLEEVRAAVSKSLTPPQAVIDKPEVPRRHVPRWVPLAALVMSAIALLRSGGSR